MHWRVNSSWFQQGMMIEAAPGVELVFMIAAHHGCETDVSMTPTSTDGMTRKRTQGTERILTADQRSAAVGRKARNPKSEILSGCGIFAGREDSEG